MDYLAIILGFLALIVFAIGADVRVGRRVITQIALGLFFTVAMLMAQFTVITGHTWTNR